MKNVSVYLSEIKTNTEVLRKFPVPKRGEISKEDNDKRLRRDFPPLMQYLINAFKNKSFLGESEEKIPEQMNVLREMYDITYPDEDIRNNYDHKEPNDIYDIKASVIWNTILRFVLFFKNPKIGAELMYFYQLKEF